jgi:hypothetical protein
VGALLENRMVASLVSEATARSAGLPAQVRAHFIGGIRQAVSSGLVGGSSVPSAPRGTPPALAAELTRLGAYVFTHGYVHAMRWTMVMPIAVVALAAISCIGVRRVAAVAAAPAAASPPAGQPTGAMSSPGSSGSGAADQSPGSSSGTGS